MTSLTCASHREEGSTVRLLPLKCLGDQRLFATDHLYPSPFRPLITSSHSIKLKVVAPTCFTTSALDQPALCCTSCRLPRPSPTLPDAPPPRLTSAPELLLSPFPVLPRIHPGGDEWDDITLVLCWPGLAAPAHLPLLSVCLSAVQRPVYLAALKTVS